MERLEIEIECRKGAALHFLNEGVDDGSPALHFFNERVALSPSLSKDLRDRDKCKTGALLLIFSMKEWLYLYLYRRIRGRD